MQITLTLTEQEAQVLRDLMDAGLKALGLPAAGAAAHLDGKLNAAAKAAMAEAEAETKTPTKKEG